MKLIDTHQHLWDPSRFPYSWCADIPILNRSFLPEDYQAASAGTGIEKTLFVECNVDDPHSLEEARFIQALSEKHPTLVGMVAAARPEKDDFSNQLEELLKMPLLRGIRRPLHVVSDEISQSSLFAKNIRRLASHHLTFDLCVLARQLPLANELIQKCHDVQFVLDHCGTPDVKGKALDPWRRFIREVASLPNVVCKVSGLVAYAGEEWVLKDLEPWVEHITECFGFERLLWGGDWPVCTLTSSLSGWVSASKELFATASESEKEKFFYRNAERIYRI